MAQTQSLRTRARMLTRAAGLALSGDLKQSGNLTLARSSDGRWHEVFKQGGGAGIWGGAFDAFMGIDRGLAAGPSEIKDNSADYARARTAEPYLFTCELVRGRAITQVPLKCWQMKGKQRIKEIDHEVLTILGNTNPYGWVDGAALLRYSLTSLDFHGHNAWQLAFSRRGRPTEIYWQIPQTYQPVPDKNKPMKVLGGIKVNDDAGVHIVPADKLCYWATDNPSDPLNGTSKISVLKNPINLRSYSVWNNIAFFKNSMRPDWMLSGAFSMNEENTSEIRRQVRRMLSGANNRAPLILGENMTAHLLTTSHEDAQWVEQQRLAQEELSAVFGVPLIYLNNLERATYENIKTAKVLLWHDTMIPEGDDFSDALNRRFFWRFWPEAATRNLALGFDYNEIEGLGEDLAMVWERVVKMSVQITEQVKNGELTRNQSRVLRAQLLGEIGIDTSAYDGDVMAGESFFVPFQQIPADQSSVQALMNVWAMRGQNPEFVESVPGAESAGDNADDVLDRITKPKALPPGPGGGPPGLPPGPGGAPPAPAAPSGGTPGAPAAPAAPSKELTREDVERAAGAAALKVVEEALRARATDQDKAWTLRQLKRALQDQQNEVLRTIRSAESSGSALPRRLYDHSASEARLGALVGADSAYRLERLVRSRIRAESGWATKDHIRRVTQVYRDLIDRVAEQVVEGKANDELERKKPLDAQLTAAENFYATQIVGVFSEALADRARVASAWNAAASAVEDRKAAVEPSEVLRRQAAMFANGLGLDLGELEAVFRKAYADGWLIGLGSALQAMDDGGFTAETGDGAYGYAFGLDWSTWKPGNAAAADQLLGQNGGAGLAALLDEAGITIKGISDTTLDQIAKALAEGAARGDSVDSIAKLLADILGDRDRALLIARTELARGVSRASLDTYKYNGVEGKSWQTFAPCPKCAENEDVVLPLDGVFPSGDTMPPAHPRCVCSLAPETLTKEDIERLGVTSLPIKSAEKSLPLARPLPWTPPSDWLSAARKAIDLDINDLIPESDVEREWRSKQPRGKEALYSLDRPSGHDHPTDPGETAVLVLDLHGTITPSDGFTAPGQPGLMLPPFDGWREFMSELVGLGVCIHICTAAMSPYHPDDLLFSRKKLIMAYCIQWGLPVSMTAGKVGAHIYVDDRMVPFTGDVAAFRKRAMAKFLKRFEPDKAGVWRRKDIPEVGKPLTDFPDPDAILPDRPRGLSSPIADLDLHRCLFNESSSKLGGMGLRPGALEAATTIFEAGYPVHPSCAGFDPETHPALEAAQRLASLRKQLRDRQVPYDELVSKDHPDVAGDDKGYEFTDWATDLGPIMLRLATPHPEDEVTQQSREPA